MSHRVSQLCSAVTDNRHTSEYVCVTAQLCLLQLVAGHSLLTIEKFPLKEHCRTF